MALISGAGPAIFALCKDLETAEKTVSRMKKVYDDSATPALAWACEIPKQGARVISTTEGAFE